MLFIITSLEEKKENDNFGLVVYAFCDLFDDKSLVYIPLCKQNNISPKQTSISHCQHQNRRAVLILPIRLIGLRESSPN